MQHATCSVALTIVHAQLPGSLFAALHAAFAPTLPALAELFGGKCAETDASQWPTISIVLDGATLSLPPAAYLLPAAQGVTLGTALADATMCLGIINTGRGPSAMFILGDTVLSQYYVVYDRRQSRVGWAKPSPRCFEV
jgi:hypothetical protein